MNDFLIRPKHSHGVDDANGKATSKNSTGFFEYMKEAVKSVNDMETKADHSIEQMTKGQTGIHETMVALQKADISLRLLLQVRNKALDAYREIMRMPF